jgi:hypothetical protein
MLPGSGHLNDVPYRTWPTLNRLIERRVRHDGLARGFDAMDLPAFWTSLTTSAVVKRHVQRSGHWSRLS